MFKILFALIIFFTLATQTITSEVKANTNYNYLIYINESFDKHPIRLRGTKSYTGYWVQQASILKKSALSGLPNSAWCEKGNYGNLILSLEPHIFFNPIMTTYYGTLKAKIYNQDGKIIKTIKVEDELSGILTVLYEVPVDKLYKKLLLALDEQIKNDTETNLILNDKRSKGIEGTFCLMLD